MSASMRLQRSMPGGLLAALVVLSVAGAPAWARASAAVAPAAVGAGSAALSAPALSFSARERRSNLKDAAWVLGVTGLLMAYDQRLQDDVQEHKSDATEHIARFAERFGNGKYIYPTMGAMYLYGLSAHNSKASNTAVMCVESTLAAGTIAQGIKILTQRHRPNTGDPPDAWDGPRFSLEHRSFPSGHSTNAFAAATVMAMQYRDEKPIAPIAYGLAALTAYSRMHDNDHWASDVFLGGAIGYFTARSIVRAHRREGPSLPATEVGPGSGGASINIRF